MKKRPEDTVLVKMMKIKKKKIISWIMTEIIKRPEYSAIKILCYSCSLI